MNVAHRTPTVGSEALDRFIEALDAGHSVTDACHAAAIGRRTAYDYRRDVPDFAARWDAAIEAGTDKLEQEAMRRAMDSSDSLLQFLLRGRRRHVYGEKLAVEATVTAIPRDEARKLQEAAEADPEAFARVAHLLGRESAA